MSLSAACEFGHVDPRSRCRHSPRQVPFSSTARTEATASVQPRRAHRIRASRPSCQVTCPRRLDVDHVARTLVRRGRRPATNGTRTPVRRSTMVNVLSSPSPQCDVVNSFPSRPRTRCAGRSSALRTPRTRDLEVRRVAEHQIVHKEPTVAHSPPRSALGRSNVVPEPRRHNRPRGCSGTPLACTATSTSVETTSADLAGDGILLVVLVRATSDAAGR